MTLIEFLLYAILLLITFASGWLAGATHYLRKWNEDKARMLEWMKKHL